MTPDPHKALREHLLYLLRGGGAHLHFDQGGGRHSTRPPRPHCPAGAPQSLAASGTHAHRPMGHLGVQPQPEARLAAVAGRLLAARRRPARRPCLGPGRRSVPHGPGGDVCPGRRPGDRSVRRRSRTGMGRPSCGKRCSSPTTTLITSGNWSWSGVCWAAGPKRADRTGRSVGLRVIKQCH